MLTQPIQQYQGENSYLPVSCSRASLYGSALWAAGSYLEESWLCLRRVKSTCKSFGVGPIHARAWTWTLVSSKHFSASPKFSPVLFFSSGAWFCSCLLSIRQRQQGRFLYLEHKSIVLAVLVVIFSLWFFHSLPPAHTGILVAGYSARVI